LGFIAKKKKTVSLPFIATALAFGLSWSSSRSAAARRFAAIHVRPVLSTKFASSQRKIRLYLSTGNFLRLLRSRKFRDWLATNIARHEHTNP
jgi:hypothetical protein